ncbi:MAG: beta-ketoacyl synthase N-terminal-like domain-containing protein, partial [Bacilli bacterium]
MRRVVITGLGAVTPVGNNVPQMWENLKTGVNGIAAITQFDASQMKVRIAGEVKNLQPELFLSPQEVRRLDRTAILALIAAQEAYQDSQLEKAVIDPYRFGVYVTSGIGGVNTL